MAHNKVKTLTRTVTYWRLVDVEKDTLVTEIDWQALQTNFDVVRKRTFEKELTGTRWVLDIPEPKFFANPPLENLATTQESEHLFGLVVSTDRDYLPVQQFPDGSQKPMAVEKDGAPAVNSFIYFLPFGNMFALMKEDMTAVQAPTIAYWLSTILRDRGMLPTGCRGLKAVPVIDSESRERLNHAESLRSVFLSGEVSAASGGTFADLLNGGPEFHGAYQIQVKIVPRRRKSSSADFKNDKTNLLSWFENVFGTIVGEPSDGGLKQAKIKMEGPDVPPNEFDILHHRLTRKRNVEIRGGNAADSRHVTLAPLAAFEQLYSSAAADYEELLKLRYSDAT